jgi:hypothetical protein
LPRRTASIQDFEGITAHMVVEDLVHDLPGHTAFLQPLFREPLLAGPGLAPELYDPDLLAADLDLFREGAPHRLMHGAERAY